MDEAMMRLALEEAKLALRAGELPVGAVVARGGDVLARAHNEREALGDPTAHAEILAIRRAAARAGGWRLGGATLYVTLEPCAMCAGAIVQARLQRVVYGARDVRAGCAGSVYRITEDPAFNHFAPADGGVLAEACEALLAEFFQRHRQEECP